MLCQLNSKTAHPTSPAVDQDTLARAEKRLGTKCLPRGKRRQGNRSRAKMVHAPRLGRQFGDPGDRELRRRTIAKEVYQPVNLVSGRDIQGVGSHFRYYAGDFMGRDDGETALALFVGPGWVPRKLGRGNCSCVHFDQHLATIRHGAGNGFIDQSFRTTSMVAADRIHCLSCFHDDGLQNSKVSSASTLSGYRSARGSLQQRHAKKVKATSMPQLLLPFASRNCVSA